MNKSMWVAILLSLGLLLWVVTGPERQYQAQDNKNSTPLMKVQVAEAVSESVDVIINIQGELLPARSVTLRAETYGRVESIIVDKSESVKVGHAILAIALDDREARLEGARAELLKFESDLEADRKLFKRGLLSSSKLKQDEANYAAAKATLSQIKNEINQTQLKAPFSGVVDDRFVEVGDYVKTGDSLARLLDISTLKVVGWVPQQKASSLRRGQTVTAQLVNDQALTGVISYVAPQANTDTRAFKVEVTIQPQGSISLLGSSVSADISTEQRTAHFLSPSVISLSGNGDLLVKTVDAESHVVSYPVKLLQSEAGGLWLTGLPDKVNVITMGQGFVIDGQAVEAVMVSSDSELQTPSPEMAPSLDKTSGSSDMSSSMKTPNLEQTEEDANLASQGV